MYAQLFMLAPKFTYKIRKIRINHTWCRRRDSNSHDFRHYPLKIACLPIPPRRLHNTKKNYSGISFALFGSACSVAASGATDPGMALSTTLDLLSDVLGTLITLLLAAR
jgi:hypothetical protein